MLSYTHVRNIEFKRRYRLRQLTEFERLWALLSRFSRPTAAAVIIVLGVVGWYFAEAQGDKVMIGDAQKGVAELWPDARYNVDVVAISEKFALGVDILNVIAEASPSACNTSFPAMELIDRFPWNMRNVDGVEQVMTLPMEIGRAHV